MPFTSYTSVDAVVRAHHIQYRRTEFIQPLPTPLSDSFRAELAFTLQEVPFERTEYGASETLIYPFLREVWKPFRDALTLWSHEPISYDEDLCGTPDYFVTRRSPFGPLVLDMPYLLVVEAKRDDFLRGWGQCAAAMLAVLKINNIPGQTVYGITTNGQLWQFGQLHGDTLILEARGFSLHNVDELAGAIRFTLNQCRAQIMAEPCPT